MRFFSLRAFLATLSATVRNASAEEPVPRVTVILLSRLVMVANIHHFAADEQHAASGCAQLNAAHAQALTAGAQGLRANQSSRFCEGPLDRPLALNVRAPFSQECSNSARIAFSYTCGGGRLLGEVKASAT
jgi:hypothetical protein